MVNRWKTSPHIFEKSRWCPSRPAFLAFFSDLKRPVPTTHRWHVFISDDLATIECLSPWAVCWTRCSAQQKPWKHSCCFLKYCGMATSTVAWQQATDDSITAGWGWRFGFPVTQWPSGLVASDDGYTLAATLVTPLEYARGHHGPLVPHHFVGWVHLAGTCEEGPKVCIGLQSLHYFLLPCTFGAFEHPKSFLIGGYSRY
jgi:hypothetical protein